jgi:hypothetical protein
MLEISSGLNRFVSPMNSTSITGLFLSLTTLNGQCFMSFCTVGSLKSRPINRLASKTLLVGFIATCEQR